MPPKNNPSLELDRATELTIGLKSVADIVERLSETLEGTVRTKGLKERITIMEYNIESNKQAYLQTQDLLKIMEERIGKNIVAGNSHIESTINTKFETFKRETEESYKSQKTETDRLEEEAKAQKTVLDKVIPYFNIISWFVTGAAGVLLTMLLTGKLHVALIP
jgi:hypothetical protein